MELDVSLPDMFIAQKMRFTFPIIAMLAIASVGCERRSEQLSGFGEIRSPQGDWRIELLDRKPGLRITEVGKDTGGTYPSEWTNTRDAFVFVDSEERIWAFNGSDRTFIYERISADTAAAWDLAGCKHPVPAEFLKRLPPEMAKQAGQGHGMNSLPER